MRRLNLAARASALRVDGRANVFALSRVHSHDTLSDWTRHLILLASHLSASLRIACVQCLGRADAARGGLSARPAGRRAAAAGGRRSHQRGLAAFSFVVARSCAALRRWFACAAVFVCALRLDSFACTALLRRRHTIRFPAPLSSSRQRIVCLSVSRSVPRPAAGVAHSADGGGGKRPRPRSRRAARGIGIVCSAPPAAECCFGVLQAGADVSIENEDGQVRAALVYRN